MTRTEDEIQRAHDILVALICDPVTRAAIRMSGHLDAIVANADVLCWVLGHQHNKTFALNLALIESMLADAGTQIVKEDNFG